MAGETGLGPQEEALQSQENLSQVKEGAVFVGETENRKPSSDSIVSISAEGGADNAKWALSDISKGPSDQRESNEKDNLTHNETQLAATLRKTGILPTDLSHDEAIAKIHALPIEVQKQLDRLGLSGIVMNITGLNNRADVSAVATYAFLEHVSNPATKAANRQELIQQAVQKAHEAVLIYREKGPTPNEDFACTMSVAMVGKDGKTTTMNGGDHEMVVVDTDGNVKLGKPGQKVAIGRKGQPLPPLDIKTDAVQGQLFIGGRGTAAKLQREGARLKGKKIGEIGQMLSRAEKKEVEVRQNIFESAGSSKRGGRAGKLDEDAYFSSGEGFHLAEIGGNPKKEDLDLQKRKQKLAETLTAYGLTNTEGNALTAADIDKVHQDLQELIKTGKLGSLDILADGMGGHNAGEVASSIVTFIVAREIVQHVKSGGVLDSQVLKDAIKQANTLINKTGGGTTLLVSVLDKDGKGYITSIGDSRISKKKADGSVDLLTSDQSLVWKLVEAGQITPSELFSHPNRNSILAAVDGNLQDNQIQIQEVQLEANESLLLQCDGVWEDVDPNDKAALEGADRLFADLVSKGSSRENALKQAMGFLQLNTNLRDVPINATAKEVSQALTSRNGKYSHDNVSAVVVTRKQQPQFNNPGISNASAEIHTQSPKPGEKKPEPPRPAPGDGSGGQAEPGAPARGGEPGGGTGGSERRPSTPTGTGNEAPLTLYSPDQLRQPHQPPYYSDNREGASVAAIEADPKYEKWMRVSNELIQKIEQNPTWLPGVTERIPTRRKVQLLQELAKRVRFSGDYHGKNDPLYQATLHYGDRDLLLVAIEAQTARAMQQANEEMRQVARANAESGLKRRKMRSRVNGATDVRNAEGPLMAYFDADGNAQEIPQNDLTSFAFIADHLMDVRSPLLGPANAAGEHPNYREIFKQLGAEASQSPEANRRLLEMRRTFYDKTKTALERQRLNYVSTSVTPDEQMMNEMVKVIQGIKERREAAGADQTKIDALKAEYQGVNAGVSKLTKVKLQKIMEHPADEIFDGALKAADMMWRRSLYEGMQLQLYQVPETIYSKDKIEDAHDQLTILAQMAGVDQIPSGQSTEQQPSRTPEPAPANGQTQQAESTLRPEPAPAAPTEREPGQETELPAAPVQEPEQPRRQEPPPAPTENNNPLPPEEELRTDFRASFAGDTEQRSKEIQNNVDPQIQKRIEKQGWRKYFAGIWQRTPWLGGVFRYREERFLDDIMKKTGVHHLEHEMLDLVTRKGKEAYDNLSRWRKYAYVGRNVFSNVFGGMYTAEQKLAQQWVQDQLRGPNADNRGWFRRRWDSIRGVTPPPSQKREGVDPELQKYLDASYREKEAFAARIGQEDEEFALHDRDNRDTLQDPVLKRRIVNDFFVIMKDYIGMNLPPRGTADYQNAVKQADEKYRRILDQYCGEGVIINGQRYSLRDVLGDQYAGLQSQFTLVGTDLRRTAEYMRDHRDTFVAKGIVADPGNVDQWMAAYDSNDPTKKINFEITVAEGQISEGARNLSLREKLHLATRERKPVLGTRSVRKGYGSYITNMLMTVGVSEVPASVIGGYLGSAIMGGVAGGSTSGMRLISTMGGGSVPFLVATTTVGLPITLPVVAISAATGGAIAALKEARRIRKERYSVEREASFGITQPATPDSSGRFGRIMNAIYGRTSREELMQVIVDQKEASTLGKGLVEDSGLFRKNAEGIYDLNSEIPAEAIAMSVADIKKTIATLAETRARIRATTGENRRFIRYNGQLGEAQQQEVLDSASKEVYERLSFLVASRQDLQTALLNPAHGVNNFRDLYRTMVDGYHSNLVGDRNQARHFRDYLQSVGIDPENNADALLSGLVEQDRTLRSRERAMNRLANRKVSRRFVGVTYTSIAFGQVFAEVRHHITRVPTIDIGKLIPVRFNGLKPQIDTTKLGNPFASRKVEAAPPSAIGYALGERANPNIAVQANVEINAPGVMVSDSIKGTDGSNITFNLPQEVRIDFDNTTKEITTIKFHDGSHAPIALGDTNLRIDNPADLQGIHDLLKTHLEPLGYKMEGVDSHLDAAVMSAQTITAESLMSKEHVGDPALWEVTKTFRDYDTSWSEGNELEFETYRDPNKPDTLIFYYKDMQDAYDKHLDRYNVNVPDEIAQEQAEGKTWGDNGNQKEIGIFFTIPGRPDAGFFLRDEDDGVVDGLVRMDPNSTHVVTLRDGSTMTLGDISKMLVNQDALKNAGTVTSITQDGVTYDNVATELYGQQQILRTHEGQLAFAHIGEMRTHGSGNPNFESWATIRRCGDGSPSELTINRIDKDGVMQHSLNISKPLNMKVDVSVEEENNGDYSIGVLPISYASAAESGQKGGTDAAFSYKNRGPYNKESRRGIRNPFMIPLEQILGINIGNMPPEVKRQYVDTVMPAYRRLEEAVSRGNEIEVATAREEFLVALQRYNQSTSGQAGAAFRLSQSPSEIARDAEQHARYARFRELIEKHLDTMPDQELARLYFNNDVAVAQQVKSNPRHRQTFVRDYVLRNLATHEYTEKQVRQLENKKVGFFRSVTTSGGPLNELHVLQDETAREMNISEDKRKQYDNLEEVRLEIMHKTKNKSPRERDEITRGIMDRELARLNMNRGQYNEYLQARNELDQRVRAKIGVRISQADLDREMRGVERKVRQWNAFVDTQPIPTQQPPQNPPPAQPPQPAQQAQSQVGAPQPPQNPPQPPAQGNDNEGPSNAGQQDTSNTGNQDLSPPEGSPAASADGSPGGLTGAGTGSIRASDA